MFGKREFVFLFYFIKKSKVLYLPAGAERHQDLAGGLLTVAKTRHEFLGKVLFDREVYCYVPFSAQQFQYFLTGRDTVQSSQTRKVPGIRIIIDHK